MTTCKKSVSDMAKSVEFQCYALLILPIVGFFVFSLYPMLWAGAKSFYFDELIPGQEKFVGIKNFVNAFSDRNYWNAWLVTVKFTFIKVPLEIAIALVLAVLLKQKLKGAGFYRSMFFLPTVVSSAIVAVIFANMFDYFGFINHWLLKFGLIKEQIDWFANKNSALAVLVMGSMWSNFGTNVIYFTAALTNVPDDLYEAATIDGAGKLAQFFKITVPMIAPVFQTILLLAINGTIQTGEYIIAMTNGAPGGMTHTAASYIIATFVPGFAQGRVNVGYGCALSIVSSMIYACVAFIYTKISAKMQNLY